MARHSADRNTTNEENNFDDASSLFNLSKNQRASIAEDTLKTLNAGWYRPSRGPHINIGEDIAFCVNNSILYTENDLKNLKKITETSNEMMPTSDTNANSSYPKFEVRHCTTLQAAQSLVEEMGEEHVGVLNFASAKNAGGGFRNGANAQEESLARSSALYLALSQDRLFTEFYGYHRRVKTGIYSHRIIYSPRVIVFKDDNGKFLSSPYRVGTVTSPAPNTRIFHDQETVRNTMTERIKRILYVFKANKHDSLVLGAFGCGVFGNSPLEVAITFRQHLESEEFKNSFKRIIFAVLNPEMCQVFQEVFTADDINYIQHQVVEISMDNNEKQQHKKTTKLRKKENNDCKQARERKTRHHHNYEDDYE